MGTYKVKLGRSSAGGVHEDAVQADYYKSSDDGKFVDFFVSEGDGSAQQVPVKRYRAAHVTEITREQA
jgi:hypothetical protein